MLALAAAFALLLLLLQALHVSDEAIAQASKDKKRDDIGSLVASGDSVEGKTTGKGKASQGPAAMPQTGTGVEAPLQLGMVLLLDGALAFLVASRRYPRPHPPT
ncbi:MAG: hypothetical protein KY391_05880 [Actinobacteria bacterium]|nr:hypothetical protein [Actinomycetota bacterium]